MLKFGSSLVQTTTSLPHKKRGDKPLFFVIIVDNPNVLHSHFPSLFMRAM